MHAQGVGAEQRPERGAPGEGAVPEGTLLWEPSADRIARSRLSSFAAWLASDRELVFTAYDDLWRWSVDHLEEFWSCVWDYFEVPGSGTRTPVLRWGDGAEGAAWFPGVRLNYVAQVLRQPPDALAILACGEGSEPVAVTYGELFELVGAAAEGLRRLGVGPGDRVAAVLPNSIPAAVGFLATASLGAVWSSCAPEFGAPSMIDRFRQIEPKVLLAATAYRYRGRCHDLSAKLAALESGLPGLVGTVTVEPGASMPSGPGTHTPAAAATRDGGPVRLTWERLCSEPAPAQPVAVEFAHPLWILYSSGTTGLPKPIVHSHGGIVLEHLKTLAFHSDLRREDRFFWFTTTGWMMWNFLVGGLLLGTTVVCYDGDPMWPGPGALWQLAQEVGITYFGTSAPYLEMCRRAGISPRALGGLDVHSIGSTGAPLSPEGFAWASSEIGDDVLVGSVSGGTDVCTGFLVSCPWLDVRAGELQCRALGIDVEAYDPDGAPVVGDVGELVITRPMPSMPVALWGDDGTRLHESYFAEFPGVWRHGDWVKITSRGSAVVYGRSDATLNRGGVRMGTSEFYRAVETLPEVADSLVVDSSELGRAGELVLFVVPAGAPGDPATLTEEAEGRIREVLRARLSPRHVPDRIVAVPALPRTINGKKIEVPVRRILLGVPPEVAVSPGALADPGALEVLLETISATGLR